MSVNGLNSSGIRNRDVVWSDPDEGTWGVGELSFRESWPGENGGAPTVLLMGLVNVQVDSPTKSGPSHPPMS